jgi:hypothetical protein
MVRHMSFKRHEGRHLSLTFLQTLNRPTTPPLHLTIVTENNDYTIKNLGGKVMSESVAKEFVGQRHPGPALRISCEIQLPLGLVSQLFLRRFKWAMGQEKDDPVALAREAFIVIGANVEEAHNERRKPRQRRS